jgi:hypothetical protein
MPDPTPAPAPAPAPTPDPATIKVDNTLPAPAYTPPDIKMTEAIPPDLRDKSYFKDKSFVDVIKEHVNLQTLLGQRPAGVPKEDASAEDWTKFLSSLRPKTAEEYALPETDFSKAKGRSDDYVKTAKEILYNANVNKHQAAAILSGFETFLAKASVGQEAKTAEQIKVREVEFEGLLDKTYGSQKQVVIDRTKKLMTDSVDPAMKEKVAGVLKDISNETLFTLTAVLDGVYKKYIAEDSSPGGADNISGDAITWQAEAEKIMQSKEYQDFRMSGHDSARAKVQELFQKVAAVQPNKK